ncbi:MAG: SDR family oxidoreductase [Clostridiales bacterium]|nr:SDR family oxidoreductase [Clostridiales bacterium]
MPTAVITGASSGIGRDIAIELSRRGYDLILAARRTDRLRELSAILKTHAEIIGIDLSNEVNCYSFYDKCKNADAEILINNAGFGSFGEFCGGDLERDLQMIDLNVRAVHILTKLFLEDFTAKNRGRILNVASAAGFLPSGPFMGTYYATKAYVLSLTRSIAKELKEKNSTVTVSALCPGPVKTEFNDVAGVRFASSGMESAAVAELAVDRLMKGKTVIVPGTMIKLGKFLSKILPDGVLSEFAYKFQRSKADGK